MNKIVICIATFKRPQMLSKCLSSLKPLHTPKNSEIEVLLVDNDHKKSAQNTFNSYKNNFPFPLHYFNEPHQGLTFVRNRLLKEAIKLQANFIAFIDDDEFAHPEWISSHYNALHKFNADISSAHVHRVLPKNSHKLLKIAYDDFYPKPNKKTGAPLRAETIFGGNVFFKSSIVTNNNLQFEPQYNLIGGEDFHFFNKARKYSTAIWCKEAEISEDVPKSRASIKYLIYRAYSTSVNEYFNYVSKNNRIKGNIKYFKRGVEKLISLSLKILFLPFSFKKLFPKVIHRLGIVLACFIVPFKKNEIERYSIIDGH